MAARAWAKAVAHATVEGTLRDLEGRAAAKVTSETEPTEEATELAAAAVVQATVAVALATAGAAMTAEVRNGQRIGAHSRHHTAE